MLNVHGIIYVVVLLNKRERMYENVYLMGQI